jgi:predicted RNA-binding protein YlqC (UPF0109 family)
MMSNDSKTNHENLEKLRWALDAVISELVDNPDDCIVSGVLSDGGSTAILTVRLADGEVGKVIGRGGKNAKALRTIAEAIAAKYGLRSLLEIPEPARRSPKRSRTNVG